MAAAVPTKEPVAIFAGDSLHWTKSFNDYPATTWALAYRLLSMAGGTAQDIAGVADGSDFEVEVTSAATALWTPGDYRLIGFLTSGTERVQAYNAEFLVKPDPAAVDHYDGRTYLQRVLALLQKTFEEGVIREVIEYSYGGVSTKVQSMEDVLNAIDRVKAAIEQEENVINGKQRRILTRFRTPM